MTASELRPRPLSAGLTVLAMLFGCGFCVCMSGCASPTTQTALLPTDPYAHVAPVTPTEFQKTNLSAYRVEAPDILLIEAVNNIRPATDPLRAGDELMIQASNVFPTNPDDDPVTNQFKIINGPYGIQSNGVIDLGPEYGTVVVEGLTLEQAKDAIESHLSQTIGLAMPRVAISMLDVAGKQAITGEHLVRPDGTVSLGVYGSLHVVGLTLDEIKVAVERHLSKVMHRPEVQVDVLSYNSKVFYVVTDGGGYGEQVVRLPYTGNETVLDAISQIQGLSDVSSKDIWIARPSLADPTCSETLPVDWCAITQNGVTMTNYQLLPGDRIFIKADHMITVDNFVAKTLAPFERVMGFSLFGTGVVSRFSGKVLQGGGDRRGGGFGGSGF